VEEAVSAKTVDKIATGIIMAVAGFIILILLGLLGYIQFRGIGHISWHFLTSASESIRAGGGIGPQLFNSLFLLVLTLIITIPLGIIAGIYMSITA
jgi:phosphate transport system permease protein